MEEAPSSNLGSSTIIHSRGSLQKIAIFERIKYVLVYELIRKLKLENPLFLNIDTQTGVILYMNPSVDSKDGL